jgi:Sulfotransferase family
MPTKTLKKLFDPSISKQEKLILIFQRPWLLKSITPFLKQPRDKRYIFIVGCYGSGTSLLNHLLSFHPEISGLPTEGAPLTDQLITPEDVGWARMVHKVLPRLQENVEHVDWKRLKEQWAFFHDSTRPFFLEKSISNWMRIPWLAKHFKNSWFIWITRNGYAVAEGLKRRSIKSRRYTADEYPNGFPIDLCAKEWFTGNQAIEEQLKGIENKIIITYEDLSGKCHETLGKILKQLPVTDKTISTPKAFKFHEELSDISNKNEESIKRLSQKEIQIIQSIAGNLLKQYKYEVNE